jgi:hypothetical protein
MGLVDQNSLTCVLQAFLRTNPGIAPRACGRRCLAGNHLRTWCLQTNPLGSALDQESAPWYMNPMNWSTGLRAQLRTRAEAWAAKTGLPSYPSRGQPPVILFEARADGASHGNFQQDSWVAINRTQGWSGRLQKPHTSAKDLPTEKPGAARELDSSNSSDALLMNCFCHPGALPKLLAGLGLKPQTADVVFGFNPHIRLGDGSTDETEIDMRIGGLFFEAKLTEVDFTKRPKGHVLRYAALLAVFDVDRLPVAEDDFMGYQLIRNVLAADQHNAEFIVLLDQRRPDLLHQWWDVHAAITKPGLRSRCGFRTWQEVAAASPAALAEFLEGKYGL